MENNCIIGFGATAELTRVREEKENETESLKRDKELVESKLRETEQQAETQLAQERRQREDDVEALQKEKARVWLIHLVLGFPALWLELELSQAWS